MLKQRKSAANSLQVKKFKLPTIFGQKSAEPSDLARPKFNNLSELANAHLSSTKLENEPPKILSNSINIPQQSNRSKFILPKLNGGSSSVSPSSVGESLTPHELSLKKIMDLKRLHISSTDDTNNTPTNTQSNSVENQQLPIDLASALNGPNASNSTIIAPSKPHVEKIDFKFIDCDIVEMPDNQPLLEQDCCLNISNVLDRRFENRTKSTTAFGKILCSKYKCKRRLMVQHGFVNKHQIKPFRFEGSIKFAK